MRRELLTNGTLATMERGGRAYGLVPGGRGGAGRRAHRLVRAGEADVRALAGAGTVAVLLPGAFYTLHETKCPPVEAFRRHGVPMAVATDCNPGSSPLASLLLAMNMACALLLGPTPEEALAGATREAARALGLGDTGRIAAGLRADLAIWNVAHPAELSYRIGFNPLAERVFSDAGER